MHITARSYRPAKPAADLVIAKINVSTAGGTNRRCGRAADLLFAFTFKTLHHRAALPFPKIIEPLEKGWTLRRGRFFLGPRFQAAFGCKRGKITSALAAHRAFCRCIFHLLKATVWTLHTELNRRGIGHWMLSEELFLSASSKSRLDRLLVPHDFGPR